MSEENFQSWGRWNLIPYLRYTTVKVGLFCLGTNEYSSVYYPMKSPYPVIMLVTNEDELLFLSGEFCELKTTSRPGSLVS